MADEQTTTQTETKEGATTAQTSNETQPATEVSPLEQAKQVLEANTKLLAQMQAERKKMEGVAANMMVEGKGFAGIGQKREETPREYAEAILSGKYNDKKPSYTG